MPNRFLRPKLYGHPDNFNHKEAEWLRDLIEGAGLPAANSSVSIYSNIRFVGQKRPQIDLVLQARFSPALVLQLPFPSAQNPGFVSFLDILAIIEVKGLSGIARNGEPDIIFRQGTVEVRYWNEELDCLGKEHDVTEETEEKFWGAKKYIQKRTKAKWAPYVCNLILFSSLKSSQLPEDRQNLLAGDSTFDDLLTQLCVNRQLAYSGSRAKPVLFFCSGPANEFSIAQHHIELDSILAPIRYISHPAPAPVQPQSSPETRAPNAVPTPPRTVQPVVPTQYVESRQPSTEDVQSTAVPSTASPSKKARVNVSERITRQISAFKIHPFGLVAAVGLFGLSLLLILALYFHRPMRHLSSTRQVPNHSAVRLCASPSSASDCQPGSIFHSGIPLQVQVDTAPATVISVVLRVPGRSNVVLLPLNTTPLFTSAEWQTVASYIPPRRKSARGIYTLWIRLRPDSDSNSGEQVITTTFIVTM